jgi:hypothetical protein
MLGGRTSFNRSAGDTFEWSGDNWELSTASEVGVLDFYGMTSALDGAGVIVFGGRAITDESDINGDSILPNDLWRFRWDGSSSPERCAGTDTDDDGRVDCDDPDCAVTCGSCGDAVCDANEQCTCMQDCGVCAGTCGDLVCSMNETCAGDCP